MSTLSDQKSYKRTQLKPLCWSSLMASTIRLAACSAFHRLSRSESNTWMSDCRVRVTYGIKDIPNHSCGGKKWKGSKEIAKNSYRRQIMVVNLTANFSNWPSSIHANLILFHSYLIRVFFFIQIIICFRFPPSKRNFPCPQTCRDKKLDLILEILDLVKVIKT